MAICLLDELTVNQIAAGEVVERPASVVKELVENALDAGATRIAITIDADSITVRDNGCGMSAVDLRLAVQRHATSKIRVVDDLARIRSYGFRGEALPSIAAVSRLEIHSRESVAEAGAQLTLEAGQVIAEGARSMAPGTQVTVTRLFFNTPVRAKFLRSERTESGRAVLAVERLALACHHVAFDLTVAGRQVLKTPGTGDTHETLIAVYGVQVARDAAIGRAAIADGGEVMALVGGAATARSDRRRQGIFVNGRPVWARGMLEAAEAASPQGLLPGRQHPLMLVYLELPPNKVDGNVHPTKAEVRLDGESAIFAGIVHAVRALSTGNTRAPSVAAMPAPEPRREQPYTSDYPLVAGRPERVGEATGGLWQVAQAALPSLRPLGQAGGKWVVCDGPGGIFLVDQHAAHERIQFERLQQVDVSAAVAGAADSEGNATSGAARQGLAVPAPVDLGPAELSAWHDFRDELELAGMDTESFGGSTVLVRTLPAALIPAGPRTGLDPAALLQDVLATLAAEGQGSALAPRLRARRALASCAAAVKASTTLSMAEIAALLKDLAACKEPLRCPHGRPTLVLLANDELDRRFGRS